MDKLEQALLFYDDSARVIFPLYLDYSTWVASCYSTELESKFTSGQLESSGSLNFALTMVRNI